MRSYKFIPSRATRNVDTAIRSDSPSRVHQCRHRSRLESSRSVRRQAVGSRGRIDSVESRWFAMEFRMLIPRTIGRRRLSVCGSALGNSGATTTVAAGVPPRLISGTSAEREYHRQPVRHYPPHRSSEPRKSAVRPPALRRRTTYRRYGTTRCGNGYRRRARPTANTALTPLPPDHHLADQFDLVSIAADRCHRERARWCDRIECRRGNFASRPVRCHRRSLARSSRSRRRFADRWSGRPHWCH